MAFKEIVTKAVIGKGKKTFTTTNSVTPECNASTILGCWVINHNFKGYKTGDTVTVEGSYDINIWYSCQNDTKTEVTRQTDTYKEVVNVPRKSDTNITSDEEIIVRSLKQPSCIKVEISGDNINYEIEKELGIEIVGDTKVRIVVDENEDDWEEIKDEDEQNETMKEIEETVTENFINEEK